MPNEEENPFTPPAGTDLPDVDLGAQQPAASQGENPYTADQPRVLGEEDLGSTPEGPQQVSAAEEIATSAVGRVDVQSDDPTTATVAYPGLETPATPEQNSTESGSADSNAPTSPVEQPAVYDQTFTQREGDQVVAPPVIGESPQPASDAEDIEQ